MTKVIDNKRAALAADLRKVRENKGWSQQELGDKIGQTQKRVSEFEQGKVKNIDTYIAYANAVGHKLLFVS